MSIVFESSVQCDGCLVEIEASTGAHGPFVMLIVSNDVGFTTMDLDVAKKLARSIDEAVAAVEAAQEKQP